MISVSEAVEKRKSIRSFIDKPVSDESIKKILVKSSRSPSGGNLQPWKIYILNGQTMNEFLLFQKDWKGKDYPEYPIYPSKLKEPYRTSRFEVGEQLYGSIGIEREDKEARYNQMLENFNFFGAPAALFCFIDRQMNQPQWSDLGMFLQTFMLLAQEEGIDTCAQESWSLKQKLVSEFVSAEADLMLFCGMAIGYKEMSAPINNYQTKRRNIDEWVTFVSKK
ncbi:nitroreductase [Pelagibacteraceae bacterium]|nr:nitroreductase [Pelagibacteraceae bacterium]